MKKLPPIEKVYEAWTAIADNRVKLFDGYAEVKSSDNKKTYTVRFNDLTFSSNDNSTYWQGYPGYPVIAVLMLLGKVPFDTPEAEKWKDIPWKELNTRFRNNYAKAVEEVEKSRDIDPLEARKQAQLVMDSLEKLPLVIKRKL